MTSVGAVLVLLVDRYMKGLLDTSISLQEVQKLMYFMQLAGEPLHLEYSLGPNGPCADNLRSVLFPAANLISGYADSDDTSNEPLSLVSGAVEDANAFLLANPETRTRIERVGALVDGFETPFGLELLATVHWITKHSQDSDTHVDVIANTCTGNDRKRPFSPRQIDIALTTLSDKGWIRQLSMP